MSTKADDNYLELLIAASKEAADQFLNNKFIIEDDDLVPVLDVNDEEQIRAIPLAIKAGCLVWIKGFFQNDTDSLTSKSVGGVNKTFDNSPLESQARKAWRPYQRLNI